MYNNIMYMFIVFGNCRFPTTKVTYIYGSFRVSILIIFLPTVALPREENGEMSIKRE